MKNRIWIVIIFIILFLPVGIGILVSFPLWPNLTTTNDWIGFWGGYAGSIVGGLITLVVMRSTLINSQKLQDVARNQELCDRLAQLVSIYCREMLSYRGRWKNLYRESNGEAIDQDKKIKFHATSEAARQPYFELEIMLLHIPEAAQLLTYMKKLLDDTKFADLSVKEADEKLQNLRREANSFITIYDRKA